MNPSLPSLTSPTSRETQAADFDALANAFVDGHSITPETLPLFAPYHTADQLIALGWIREHHVGRWACVYIPAGALVDRLFGVCEANSAAA